MGKNIKSYIKNIQDDFGYASQITVEHRSNNPKRDFYSAIEFKASIYLHHQYK